MLRRWIQNLRRKPKGVRNNVALGIAGSMTAIVFTGWVVLQNQVPLIGATGEIAEKTSAFSGLLGQIKDQAAAAIETVPSKEELEAAVAAEEEIAASANYVEATTTSTTTSTTSAAQVVRIATTTSSSTEQDY